MRHLAIRVRGPDTVGDLLHHLADMTSIQVDCLALDCGEVPLLPSTTLRDLSPNMHLAFGLDIHSLAYRAAGHWDGVTPLATPAGPIGGAQQASGSGSQQGATTGARAPGWGVGGGRATKRQRK